MVETKAGAAGAVGAQVAASAKPDGYTLLSHNNGLAGYAAVDKLFGRQPKTTRADFIPLARLCADPVLLLVNEQQPWKTLEEFIADAKKRPEQDRLQSGGLYGASHLPVALIEKAAGITGMRHLPTTGGGPAITAVLGNNAQMTHADRAGVALSTSRPARCARSRRSASSAPRRCRTCRRMKEKGFDVVYYLWVGLFAPKGTPAPIVSTLAAAIDKAGASAQFNDRRSRIIGLEPTLPRRPRSSPSSGTRTPGAPRKPCARSARSG